MSRSYKKTSVYKDGYKTKKKGFYKRAANKKVRKCDEDFGNFNTYKKLSDTWNICDYRFYKPLPKDASDDYIMWWRKFYRNK